jgi:hypothetical protein
MDEGAKIIEWKPKDEAKAPPPNNDPPPKSGSQEKSQPLRMIQSSGRFTRGFVPPDYLVDGILQRRFCYTLTASTGVGKTAVMLRVSAHVALGRSIGNIPVE